MWIWKKKKSDDNDTLKTNGKSNTELISGEDLQVEAPHNTVKETAAVSGVVFREKDSVTPEEPKDEPSTKITGSALISVKFRKPSAQTVEQEEKPKRTQRKAKEKSDTKTKKTTPKSLKKITEKIADKVQKPIPPPFIQDLEQIPTPPEAPRIVSINGKPVIVCQNEIYPPLMFFGNPENEKKAEITFEQIHKASEAGVHLFSLAIDFPSDENGAKESFELAEYLLRRIIEIDPKAKVIFRVVFAGSKNWVEKYPNAVFRYEDGSLAEPSVCDDEFWGDVAKLLVAFTKSLRALPLANHIIGLHLDRGEWFFAEGWGYDTSKAGEKWFREWTRYRYSDDQVALQASWLNGKVKFENIQVPEFSSLPLSKEGFLRARRNERPWVDYHLFMSDAMVARIKRLAWEVKKASDGWFLIAVSYGYTFEWSHPANAHLSLGKLLRTREVDIICGPPSYRDRLMGGTAAFPCPIDSFPLNGKLFVSEEDFKTPISQEVEPDDFNPVMESPKALEAAHWRGLGCALAHASGISWMDLWGNGWLNTPNIWQRAKQVLSALTQSLGAPLKDPEVVVLIDERSLAYLSDQRAFKELIQDSREAVLRAGVSAGFYLLSDLAHRLHFPDAKLYIFLNAWDIRPEVRSAIRNRLQKDGKTLFWVYSAGLFELGRPALQRVREVTGIAIRPQPFSSRAGTTILNRKHQLTELLEERALSVVEQLEPSYFAIPEEDCIVLGEYTQTGLPSLVVREIKSEDNSQLQWRSVFLGEPLINEKIIRGLCALAGVQVWNYYGDVVHARPPYLSIHYTGAGHRTATLPDRWCAYDLIQESTVVLDATHIKSQATEGATQVMLVGEDSEIEEIIRKTPESLLNIETLPEKQPDTISEEDLQFEVPVVSMPYESEFLALLSEVIQKPLEEVQTEATINPAKPKKTKETKPQKTITKKRKTTKKEVKQETETNIGVVFREKD